MGDHIKHEKQILAFARWSIFTESTQILWNRFFCNLTLETFIENRHENQNLVKIGQKYQAPDLKT
jgi:hypothetical protein